MASRQGAGNREGGRDRLPVALLAEVRELLLDQTVVTSLALQIIKVLQSSDDFRTVVEKQVGSQMPVGYQTFEDWIKAGNRLETRAPGVIGSLGALHYQWPKFLDELISDDLTPTRRREIVFALEHLIDENRDAMSRKVDNV